MKKLKLSLLPLLISVIATTASAQQQAYTYEPKSLELQNTIARMDSIFFNACYTGDVAIQNAILADSMEFYHENGGLLTSKKDLIAAIKDNVSGKISRVTVKGSIEVYPIEGFGAVEFGLHEFINHEAGETPSRPNRFVIIWRQKNDQWQITRVIDLN